jgi:hypothetical protein
MRRSPAETKIIVPVFDLIRSHAWLAVATLVIAAGLAAAKSPKVGSLFARVPREQRPRVVLALGLVSGILDAITRGTPWPEALVYGVVSAALAALGHGAAGGLAPADTLLPGQVRGTSPPYGSVTIEGEVGTSSETGMPPVLVARDTTVSAPPDVTPVPITPDTSGVPRAQLSEPWGPL